MDKQIAEMARIIAFDLCPNRHVHAKWGEEAQCYSDNNFAECTKIKNVVDKLYNAGYRKIPEGVVVFTEENMEQTANWLVTHPKMQETMWKLIKAWRKETAEKFAERLKERLDISVDGYSTSEVISEIEYKIDEIAKEITEGKV